MDKKDEREKAGNGEEQGVEGTGFEMPALDFSAFLLSLSHNALMHLDQAETGGKDAKVQLPLARQFIGILEMLKEKTKGNLVKEEEKLVSSLLFDLRMRYIEIRERRM